MGNSNSKNDTAAASPQHPSVPTLRHMVTVRPMGSMTALDQAHSHYPSDTHRGAGVCTPMHRAPQRSPRGRDRIPSCCPPLASKAHICSVWAERLGEVRQKAGKRQRAAQWLNGKRGQLQDTYKLLLTRPFSTSRVVITIMRVFSCHTICQKSLTVASRQPWLAM